MFCTASAARPTTAQRSASAASWRSTTEPSAPGPGPATWAAQTSTPLAAPATPPASPWAHWERDWRWSCLRAARLKPGWPTMPRRRLLYSASHARRVSPAGWSVQMDGGHIGMNAISCPGALSVCYVAGEWGLVGKTTDRGATWSATSLGMQRNFDAINCPSSTWCVAVGQNGLIEITHDGGGTWTQEQSGT